MESLVPLERIERRILVFRGHKVMLDVDLASLYGVTTKRLNEQVKRNRDRFPEDFTFRLTAEEKAEVVAKCDHLQRLKFSPTLPYVFTEHGALMLASVLNSPTAIHASIQIVRVFIRLREALASDKGLRRRLDALEKKYDTHDVHIKEIFAAIHALMEPPPGVAKRRIGFRPLPSEDGQ
ncbi:MAG: ORF6N domain-containing protein [candidate division NC10 bacterium]|nr:ORF6N domain-containing protein [candidate division NC10 bacterium]